jgi:ABC-2 type transport system permease protein
MRSLLNIFWLGWKELYSLGSDIVMVLFVAYAFTAAIYVQATGTSSEVHNGSIAFVDEDGSTLATELMNAFYPPLFKVPKRIAASAVETAMDKVNLCLSWLSHLCSNRIFLPAEIRICR